MTVKLDGHILRIDDVVAVARREEPVELTDAACKAVRHSRQTLEAFVEDPTRLVYGVNTGFGRLVSERISAAEITQLQENLIFSHSAGVGALLSEEVVRAAMLLRINSLAKGYSGVRLELLNTLVTMLNRKVHPAVPSKGSLGASGDLAPLAHIAAVLLGKGRAVYNGEHLSGKAAMDRAGIEPIRLEAKEGLALINGTPVMCALGALAVADSEHLCDISDAVGALSVFVLDGSPRAFAKSIQDARPHPGQIASAKTLRELLETVPASPREGVQDAYSLRCIPQVHGAVRTALDHAAGVIETEINSATDNPLVFPDSGEILSGGNFHGEPIALVTDYLKLAMAELGSISERRINRLLHPDLNGDLPPFLVQDAGLNSGYMIAQYTAAALASENKVLAHPSSVDSIPVSGDQEDHVSMGTNAARHLRTVVENVGTILAVELLCGCQANEYIARPLPAALADLYAAVRQRVPALSKDEEIHRHIKTSTGLIWEKSLTEAVVRSIVTSD